jgi:hypothetical protein
MHTFSTPECPDFFFFVLTPTWGAIGALAPCPKGLRGYLLGLVHSKNIMGDHSCLAAMSGLALLLRQRAPNFAPAFSKCRNPGFRLC